MYALKYSVGLTKLVPAHLHQVDIICIECHANGSQNTRSPGRKIYLRPFKCGSLSRFS